MELNDEQRAAVAGLTEWLETPGGVWAASLNGSAGTGKTTVLGHMAGVLGGRRVGLCAPTHKALKQASVSLSRASVGLHSLAWTGTLAAAVGKRGVTEHEPDEKGKPRFSYSGRRPVELDDLDVLIVDEVSMVDERGLRELREALPSACRVIFVGDFAQLRPVAGKSVEPAFAKAPISFTLDRIMRTAGEGVGINDVAHCLRTDDDYRGRVALAPCVLEYTDREVWQKVFMGLPSGVAIAYRNARVDGLNAVKRERQRGRGAADFVEGDRKVVKDHAFGGAANPVATVSDVVTVLRVLSDRCRVAPGVEVWNLAVEVDGGGRTTMPAITLAQARDKWHPWNRHLADLADRAARTPSGPARGKAWRLFYEEKQSVAVLADPWAYTAHSAQGSTFDDVFVDWPDLERIQSDADRRAAKYVAVSRARRTVHILRPEGVVTR